MHPVGTYNRPRRWVRVDYEDSPGTLLPMFCGPELNISGHYDDLKVRIVFNPLLKLYQDPYTVCNILSICMASLDFIRSSSTYLEVSSLTLCLAVLTLPQHTYLSCPLL